MNLESVIHNIGAFTGESILIADVDLNDGAVMTLRWCNPAFTRVTGLTSEDIVGKSARILVGKSTDRRKHIEIIAQLMNWESFVNEMRTNRKDGTELWVEMSWQPLKDETDTYRFWICVLRDITKQKQADAALENAKLVAERSQTRLIAAIESLDDAFVIFDADDRLVLCNSKYHELSRIGAKSIEGKRYEEILRGVLTRGEISDARGREEEWLKERMRRHNSQHSSMIQEFSDGRVFKVLERRTSNEDIVKLHVDITEIKRQQKKLERYAADLKEANRIADEKNRELEGAKVRIEHASLHDALTDLPNRRYLDQVLQANCDPSGTIKPLLVLHIDLDRFKQINDAFGHYTGDKVLVHVARLLQRCAPKDGFVARVGGDEFVIMSGISLDDPEGTALAERVIAEMGVPFMADGIECRFGAGIGIARSTDVETDPTQLLINADIALYKAKKLGRNRWVAFTEQLQSETVATKRIGDEILRAFERQEFIAHYQPQFDAKTLELVGVEALVRWQHPKKGLLAPAEFMGVAEDMNLIKTIDQVVLRRVVADWALWEEANIFVPRVSINVSWRRLCEPEFIFDIRNCGLDPARLSVEVHESIFVDEADGLLSWNIDQLREMGVTIELDDFGTGHSSIVGLINLEPNRLKIDRKFITPITTIHSSRALVKSIIDIGRSLNVEIVAEGVETVAHGVILRDLGCDILQGYGYGRPMSATSMCEFIRDKVWLPNMEFPHAKTSTPGSAKRASHRSVARMRS